MTMESPRRLKFVGFRRITYLTEISSPTDSGGIAAGIRPRTKHQYCRELTSRSGYIPVLYKTVGYPVPSVRISSAKEGSCIIRRGMSITTCLPYTFDDE